MGYEPKQWERGFNDTQVIYSGSTRIAAVFASDKKWRENANLIKAAPDLLDALTQCQYVLERIENGEEVEESIITNASLLAQAARARALNG